ncbi:binding-protein-dependent transport system inner membrane protein [Thermincola ferriacetica]|uniref:Binding-protein-dependent transport system inner membrane protein n=1 Tax=Thermincola ferriacetica TaxID=281456 RepID=A0A0L6VZU0_9FIRM|nr:ABC transporter permease [Thermincola ferriacetica]KNZ68842.1 binding-protein-dependent transport system inner membrane protein [Thermincola ferriacetica]
MKNVVRANPEVRATVLRIIFVITLILAWELVAEFKIIDPFYISQPSQIFKDLKHLFISGELGKHLTITLKEAFLGLTIGTFLGMAGGFILGRIELLAKIFEPIITALYGIPKLALAPVFVLWFGLGIESKVFLSLLMVFYLVFFNTYGGIKSVDPNLVGAVKLMGANELQLFTKVVLPSCVPWILAGLRGGLGASLLGAIVGEYIGASAGLGWMIQYATGTYQINRVMSCIVLLLFTGLILNTGLKILEKRLLKWRPRVDYDTIS